MTTEDRWPYPGSRWWRFDFHSHTPASLDTRAWQDAIGTPQKITPQHWLLKFMAAEIDCVAVTDHNSGAWIDKLKDTYAEMVATQPAGFRELHLFPGVEISVHGGFHLLAIFDQHATTDDIHTLLAKVGYDDTRGDSDGVTRKAAVEVIETVLKAGGVPIPAHVDRGKGLFQTQNGTRASLLDANTVRQVIACSGVLAMEQIDRASALPEVFDEARRPWARILGSDCHSFQGQAVPGSHYTWVKMARPTLEGLRLALLDGDGVSLRRSDEGPFDPWRLPEHFIVGIDIADARYMGNGKSETIELTPYYNVLIGGRGTGKSTVVHALRLAYRREDDLKAFDERLGPRGEFERFARTPGTRDGRTGALREGTEITVALVRDGVWHRLRWRQDGEGTVVDQWDGQDWKATASQAVTAERFPLRIFSQGQIAAMASENRQALLDAIDAAGAVMPLKQAFEDAKRTFLTQRARLRELDARLAGRDEAQRRLDDVQRKLQTFAQSHHAEVLKAHQVTSRQRREVDTLIDQADAWPAGLRSLVEGWMLDDWPDGIFDATTDADMLEWRSQLTGLLNTLRQTLTGTAGRIDEKLAGLRADARFIAWQDRVLKAQGEYQAVTAALAAQGVQNPQEFGQLVQQRQQLEAEMKRFDAWQLDRNALVAQITKQWRRVMQARLVIARARRAFLTEWLSDNPFVRMSLITFGFDADIIEKSLREDLLGVSDGFKADILEIEDDRPRRGLVAELLNCRSPIAGLGAMKRALLRISPAFGGRFRTHLQRKLENQPEFADRIRCWFPEDDLHIKYSRTGDGRNFMPISQGSPGQRAAALLAFLLAFGNEPLVLDQPEDDLDNHLIYALIVRQIRENKGRRQLIIVTHNPNVVVNGDAELVQVFAFAGGQCRVQEHGALQERPIREEVCRVMEGGREAFERRWARLGREV